MIVRALTEWTSTDQTMTMDQTSISEGIGGVTLGASGSTTAAPLIVNVRQAYIQGIDNTLETTADTAFFTGVGFGLVPNIYLPAGVTAPSGAQYTTRRYQVNLALGLLTQDKLLPVKFMASQLAIEITLEQPAACIFAIAGTGAGTPPSYAVTNVNIIPEILEFDSSYDAMFLKGLQDGGVPLKFSSWHTFIFSTNSSSAVNLLVQERSRSVKALFAMQRRSPYLITSDSGATFFDSSTYASATGNTMYSYQWRIGGRYFPAQPVQTSFALGQTTPNGGAESYVELQKALNIVGDYRLSTSANTLRWALPAASSAAILGTTLNELDYATAQAGYGAVVAAGGSAAIPTGAFGAPYYVLKTVTSATVGAPDSGIVGSACYVSAIDLETSNGVEISGLNAEEQSDIAFIANWAVNQANFNLEVYSFYDAMIILRENNVLELIQ